ncbi:unnamed protein product [Pleuronectes platessa]|uniref:Uncharacterized protein n=1 Tax=Pleuronectes platessa TaxID=8262 RepID=A0A9N7TKH3_PLEPL|nr:unnamed protein product [Pleuronectes platessa]
MDVSELWRLNVERASLSANLLQDKDYQACMSCSSATVKGRRRRVVHTIDICGHDSHITDHRDDRLIPGYALFPPPHHSLTLSNHLPLLSLLAISILVQCWDE